VLDPTSTINAFKSYIPNLFGGLTQVAQNAITTAEESRTAVESLVVSVVDSARRDVQTLVNRAAADIWTAVNNSAIGTALRIEQCGEKGIQTVAGEAFQTGKYFF
jgi:phage-related protein